MQSNFRTLIFYIIILTLVFLPLKIVLAGQDDSGLKVVMIEGKDLIGEAIDNMYHPTDFYSCDTCSNFVTDGQNLIPVNLESLYYTSETSFFVTNVVNSITFTGWQSSDTKSVLIAYSLGESPTEYFGTLVKYPTAPVNEYFTFYDYYSPLGGFYTWILTTAEIRIYNGTTYTTQFANPLQSYFSGDYKISGDIWSGRLFVGGNYYICYSSASDKRDFTVSSTAGGVIRIPDGSTIKFLYSTTQGLLIGTDTGIWLLSGADTPESWTFQPIKKMNVYNGFRADLNKFVIMSFDWDFYIADNLDIQYLGNLRNIYERYFNYEAIASQPTPISANIVFNKYLFMPFWGTKASKNGFMFSILLDLTTKKYVRLPSISYMNSNYYWSMYSSGYYYGLYSSKIFNGGFYARTNNMTFPNDFEGDLEVSNISLDGNTSVRKNITRVEIDISYHPISSTLNTSEVYLAIGSTSRGSASRTFNVTDTETYPKTLVANMNITGNAFTMRLKSESAFIRRIRIYYREIGNNKKDGTL